MTKAELIELVSSLRAENSRLTTQLAAERTTVSPSTTMPGLRSATQQAVARLAAHFPLRKYFSDVEVQQEIRNNL